MSITKFRAHGNTIEPIEVLRETKSAVFIQQFSLFGKELGEKRELKRSSNWNYFDSWEEAKQFLLDEASARVIAARRNLELANARHGNIKGMKPPKAES